jgi:cation diffusion facilitator family transporter
MDADKKQLITNDNAVRDGKGGTVITRWGWAAIGINIILSLLNLEIALASGSLAVTSEMIHNLVDLMASIVLLIGLIISQRQSKSFPYGLYKVENVVAVALSALIFLTGYEIVRDAVLGAEKHLTVGPLILAGVALSALIPFFFSHFELRGGKLANSPSLIASAMEYRTHIFTSGVILVSLVSQYFGLNLDRFAALVVVFFIVRTGWYLLKDGMRVLLDASLDAGTLDQVRQIIESDPATDQIKSLTGRNSGRYRFVEAVITFRIDNLKKAHDASQRIETAIRAKVPFIERVLIHYEPSVPAYKTYAFPLVSGDGSLSSHFGEAPYFALVRIRLSDGEIVKQEVIHNPYQDLEKAKGMRVAEWLVSQKVDCIMLSENLQGKGPEYVFADAGTEIIYTEADKLSLLLEDIKLKPPDESVEKKDR